MSGKNKITISEEINAKLMVYDVLGNLVCTYPQAGQNVSRFNFDLDMPALPEGTYFIKITASAESKAKKFKISRSRK